MKKRTQKKLYGSLRNFLLMKKMNLFILMTIFIVQSAFSQTATSVMTQIPCNNDGICTITTTGIPLPITYTYYVNGGTIVHSNINSATDQLTNIALSGDGWISCLVSGGGVSQWTSVSYTPPFYFSLNATPAICPSTTGTVSATQISGTPGPFSYSWTNSQTLNSYSGNNISVSLGEYISTITDFVSK